MAAASQNGWRADARAALGITTFTVPGTDVKLPLLPATAPLLLEFARWWHLNVEPLRADWCWGYAARNIRGSSTSVSNHASGTAIDLNAPKHPLGVGGTLGAKKAAVIAKAEPLGLRSGAAYTRRPDEMHAEVDVDAARAAELVRALQAEPSDADGAEMLKRGSVGELVTRLQARLNAWFPAYSILTVDGEYGPATESVVREFQKRAGLVTDGIAGPATLRALAL